MFGIGEGSPVYDTLVQNDGESDREFRRRTDKKYLEDIHKKETPQSSKKVYMKIVEESLNSINEDGSNKKYTIIQYRKGKSSEITGTLEYLIDYFSYTLEVGYSWQNEKGNKKINRKPTSIKSLITNLNNAESNASRDGYPRVYYEQKI